MASFRAGGADSWTSRAYVLGEILISLVAIMGAGYILIAGQSQTQQTVAASVLTAVTVFWFSRRATEQATTQVKESTNSQLAELRTQLNLMALKKQDFPVDVAAPVAARIVQGSHVTPPPE